MNINKKEIANEINNLTHQKYQIEQKLLSLQKQYSELFKPECKQYIGKCYKQYIEDDNYSETVYYKVLDIYSEEDDFNYFWVLVVEDHMENDIDMPLTYIYKTSVNLLGHKKFFLRQLVPISEEEFNKALNDIINTIKQISKNIKDDKDIVFKCPNCNSTSPLVALHPNITDVEYICKKCGCKISTCKMC